MFLLSSLKSQLKSKCLEFVLECCKPATRQSGNALTIFALLIIPVIAFTAFAVDLTKVMTTRVILQRLADQAVLDLLNQRAQLGWTAFAAAFNAVAGAPPTCVNCAGFYQNRAGAVNNNYGNPNAIANDAAAVLHQVYYLGNGRAANTLSGYNITNDEATLNLGMKIPFNFGVVIGGGLAGGAGGLTDIVIDVTSRGQLGVTIISIIADTSGSMNDCIGVNGQIITCPAGVNNNSKLAILQAGITNFTSFFNPNRDSINLVGYDNVGRILAPFPGTANNNGVLSFGAAINDFVDAAATGIGQTNASDGLQMAFIDFYDFIVNRGGAGANRSVDIAWVFFTDGNPTAGVFNFGADTDADSVLDAQKFPVNNGGYVPTITWIYPLPNTIVNNDNPSILSGYNDYKRGFLNLRVTLPLFDTNAPNILGVNNPNNDGPPFFSTKRYVDIPSPLYPAQEFADVANIHNPPSQGVVTTDPKTKADINSSLSPFVESNAVSDAVIIGLVRNQVNSALISVLGQANDGNPIFDGYGIPVPDMRFCVPFCGWDNPNNNIGQQIDLLDWNSISSNIIPGFNLPNPPPPVTPFNLGGLNNFYLKANYYVAVAWTHFLRSLAGSTVSGIRINSSRVYTVGISQSLTGNNCALPAAANRDPNGERPNNVMYKLANGINNEIDNYLTADVWNQNHRKDALLFHMANDPATGQVGCNIDANLRQAIFPVVPHDRIVNGGIPNWIDDLFCSKDTDYKTCGKYYPATTANNISEIFQSIARDVQLSLVR
jgi:Flp pilus assembly protein TadG